MRFVSRPAAALAALAFAGCASPSVVAHAPTYASADEPVSAVASPSPGRAAHGELLLVEALDPTLAPGMASLSIEASHPTEIWVGETNLGTTPIVGARLPVGTHVLQARNPVTNVRELHAVTLHDREVVSRRLSFGPAPTPASAGSPDPETREPIARRVAP